MYLLNRLLKWKLINNSYPFKKENQQIKQSCASSFTFIISLNLNTGPYYISALPNMNSRLRMVCQLAHDFIYKYDGEWIIKLIYVKLQSSWLFLVSSSALCHFTWISFFDSTTKFFLLSIIARYCTTSWYHSLLCQLWKA